MKKNSNAELDLILQVDELVVPVEIKSGASGSLKSLHQFMEESKIELAIRIYTGKMKIEECTTPGSKKFTLLNVPHYLSGY